METHKQRTVCYLSFWYSTIIFVYYCYYCSTMLLFRTQMLFFSLSIGFVLAWAQSICKPNHNFVSIKISCCINIKNYCSYFILHTKTKLFIRSHFVRLPRVQMMNEWKKTSNQLRIITNPCWITHRILFAKSKGILRTLQSHYRLNCMVLFVISIINFMVVTRILLWNEWHFSCKQFFFFFPLYF